HDLGLSPERHRTLLRLLDTKTKVSEEEFLKGLEEIAVPAHVFSKGAPGELEKMIADFAAAGITNIVYAPEIVRGFDYYTGMVFEVFDTNTENSRSLFGGGRYDNLTALFDTEPLPGVGFGMGDVTMRDFLETHGLMPAYKPAAQVYVAVTDPELAIQAQTLAGQLRRGGLNVAIDFGEKKLGDQIKTASKHKIPYLVVVGENELASHLFKLKNLETGEEKELMLEDIPAIVRG
ncbi:MAG TPA: His/Gly/Thr/Pro-type tRNA ligase C-terminal domain-containing protein, partial [Candidatus Paceibacterota bacterium]|nr:His/Gly/Thr/Pro-type tRNA ligase C-terminal domain-containing protein [Candidatus Paceibacterota bacterium]